MAISVQCGACGKRFRVADEFAGRTARCSACKQAIQIPISEPALGGALSASILEVPATEVTVGSTAKNAEVAAAPVAAMTAEIVKDAEIAADESTSSADLTTDAAPLPAQAGFVRRFGSALVAVLRKGWQLTIQVARFYRNQWPALRRRFVEYTVAGEKSFDRGREILLSHSGQYETARRDETGWQIELADCCVVCGRSAEGDWETENREVPDVTYSLWMPILGLLAAIAIGWYCGSVLAGAIVWLSSFFAGYALCRSVSVQLRLRRCAEHGSFASTPQVYLLGEQLAVRTGHVSVRKAFFDANRGADASEVPDPASLTHPYAQGRFRYADSPRREPTADAKPRLAPVDRWCGSCQQQIPRSKPACPGCQAELVETRREIFAALREYQSNPPRELAPPMSKSGKVITKATTWGLTGWAMFVNPAAGLATAAKVLWDEKQEKKLRESGQSPDHDRSDVVTLRRRGYPVHSSVWMQQLVSPILDANADALAGLVQSESSDLARGAVLGLADCGADVLTVFAGLRKAAQSSQDASVRAEALELMGKLGLEKEILAPIFQHAARDAHEAISSLAATKLKGWGIELPVPEQTVQLSADNAPQATADFNETIPLAETAEASVAGNTGQPNLAHCDICLVRATFSRDALRSAAEAAGWHLIDQTAFQENGRLVDLAMGHASQALASFAQPIESNPQTRLAFIQATMRVSSDDRWLICPACYSASMEPSSSGP